MCRHSDGYSAEGIVMGSPGPLSPPVDVAHAQAFNQLLSTGRPLTSRSLAARLGVSLAEGNQLVAMLRERGQVIVDDQERIVGAGGLSVVPSRHRIFIGGRSYWTWCAYDAVGIVGAVRGTGSAVSRSPLTGAGLEVRFWDGQPEPTGIVIFMAEGGMGRSLYDEWCPHVNFFEDEASALAWAAREGVEGLSLTVAKATAKGSVAWARLLPSRAPGTRPG
jgi:alkylmercury lyase